MHASPREVLDFWFGAPGSAERGNTRALWFTKSDATDTLIRTRFGNTVDAALRGELDHWSQDLQGALALIVLLDQFTRNIHRDTPRAFAGDAAALALAQRLTDTGLDRQLSLRERWFVYMPFEHAEDLPMQERSVALLRQLADEGLAEPLDWAIKHRDVVARFGRFPHRNAVLGRPTTPEEEGFLRQPGSRF
ncbi:MAG: DUF924 domain-containing protein [Burkholderiales bacterium]|nr:DUF924 domain-containing protein [Burkholderiales bacterium]